MSLIGNADGKVLRGKINKLNTLRGYSAYEVAVLEGFVGTEEEWLATLKGEKGDKPIKGVDYWTDEDKNEIKQELEETTLGDIETALDSIIAIQEELINNGGGANTCPNCGEFTGEGPCPNNCYEMEQGFYVGGEYYTYYSGMTWEDFINSGYNKTVTCPDCGSKNKLAYTYDDDSVYFLIGACCGIGHVPLYYGESYEMPVCLADAIYAEHSYYY